MLRKVERKTFNNRVQKRPNFSTNCNEIYGLCIFAAGVYESFLIQFIKKLLLTQTFAFTTYTILYCLKTVKKITFPWKFSSSNFIILVPLGTAWSILHTQAHSTAYTHMWAISSSLYYILETISVHILLRKLFSHGNKPKAKARMMARKVEEIWIYLLTIRTRRDLHSLFIAFRTKGGRERVGGRAW